MATARSPSALRGMRFRRHEAGGEGKVWRLTDEQKSLRDMLTEFFGERFGGAQGVEAIAQTTLDAELWSAVSELGLAGAMVPEEDGGLGLDLLTATVIAEVTGHYAVPAPVLPSILAAWLIATAGSAEQKGKWLPKLLGEGVQAAFALAEEAGWSPADWTLSGAALTGTKLYVERADSADLFIVGGKDGSLAIVEAGSATLTPVDMLDRTRPLFAVSFDAAGADVLTTDAAVAGKLFDALCITSAADALGAASAIQARAIGYAKERKQYGQLIGSFQALKHQLADMSVELEPARPLVWYAAHAWDMGQDDSPRMAALAKTARTGLSGSAAAVCRCRSFMITRRSRLPGSAGMGSASEHARSAGSSAIIFLSIALVGLERGTTRGRWKAWSSTPDRTSWCRSRMRPASMTSMMSCWVAAGPVRKRGLADIARRSAQASGRSGDDAGIASRAVRAVRDQGRSRIVDRPGALPDQRLLGANPVRLPGCHGEGLRRHGGHPMWQ